MPSASGKWTLGTCLLVLMLIPAVSANSVVGHIMLTITNSPPRVVNITFDPAAPYSDAELRCIPGIVDEQPDKVHVLYNWKLNGADSREHGSSLIGLHAGDVIECEAIPTDMEGLPGDSMTGKVTVATPATSIIVTKAVMNMFGKNADYAAASAVEKQGMGGVTAYVVYEGVDVGNLLGLAVVLLVLCALALMTVVLRRQLKR